MSSSVVHIFTHTTHQRMPMARFQDNTVIRSRFIKPRSILAVALVVALLWVGASPATSASRSFSFEGCVWSSTTHQAGAAGWGTFYSSSLTIDHNGGCGYLDADVKYYVDQAPGPTATKWCDAIVDWANDCTINWKEHYQGSGRAESNQWGHWQSSGWWG